MQRMTPEGAEVLVKDALSGAPLLLRKGNIYYSSTGFTEELGEYFSRLIQHLANSPIQLESSGEAQILEAVKKDGNVVITLWKPGAAELTIDTKKLGLGGDGLQAKDIIFGNTLPHKTQGDSMKIAI